MPVYNLFGGTMPVLVVTTEETGATRVDEFGETVPVERVLSVNVANDTLHTWIGTVWQSGVEVFSVVMAPGASIDHVFKKNQQFLWHEYSVSVGRQ